MPEENYEMLQFCALPEIPTRTFGPGVSPHRERIILSLDRKWVNGTKLRYCFFQTGSMKGSKAEMDMVRDGFRIWRETGIGIRFEEVESLAEAEIRIGFRRGDGSWSYVGRDVVDIPGSMERTMNFGWNITQDPRGVDVAVHEIGHTLGFNHEHQNPFAGIIWNERKVLDTYAGPPNNWDEAKTRHNILRKRSSSEVDGSTWDRDSIMHYAFPPGLILQPADAGRNGIRPAPGLSDHDIAEALRFYPPIDDDDALPHLVPFESQQLELDPGEQADFVIEPTMTRDYTLRTFGGSDTVIVLFEDVDGNLEFVDGDDDSGQDLNAEIKVRLVAGRRYVLRIRLYFAWATGETAVMLF